MKCVKAPCKKNEMIVLPKLIATILDKMLEHGSQDRATLPFPPCNFGLENPNQISCRLSRFNNIARGRERQGLVVFQGLLSMIVATFETNIPRTGSEGDPFMSKHSTV